ncbi:MAG TPA: hypothetical protein VF480_11555 [Verrucomicrobiae bacterium]
MKRMVQRELLDTLPFDDARAVRSRRDLRRVNGWMRNHAIMAGALKNNLNGLAPKQITDSARAMETFCSTSRNGSGRLEFRLQAARAG